MAFDPRVTVSSSPKGSNIHIVIDSEDRSSNVATSSSADFAIDLNLNPIKSVALASYRISGVPTIVTGVNDKFIITYSGTDYTVTLRPGRYAPDYASNTQVDNLIIEIQRAINADAALNTHILVNYLKAANKLTFQSDAASTTIKVHPSTPAIGATLGLSTSATGAAIPNGSYGALPYTGTWLLTKFIDVHSPELTKFGCADTGSTGASSGLIYRIFLTPPCFDCTNDIQSESIMFPKWIKFNPRMVGSYHVNIQLDGESGMTFPFQDASSVGSLIDISLVLIAEVASD